MERFTTLIGNTPLGAQLFGSPDNIAFMLRETGMTELVLQEAEARNKQLREIEVLLTQPPLLAAPFVSMLQQGASIPAVLKAIGDYAAKQMEIEEAAQQIVSEVQNTGTPPKPQPFDVSTIARSSVPVWPSDYHQWEAKKCRDWLSSNERHNEETIGRPTVEIGEDIDGLQPNILGILNVVLHMMEHDRAAAADIAPPPPSGPLPAIGSPPKVAPVPPGS
jgi:hypothetical protein